MDDVRESAMNTSKQLPELDARLAEHLRNREAAGVLDIKCHIDVTRMTAPADVKRALVNVFEQDERGDLKHLPLRSVPNFARLMHYVL